MRTGNSLRRIAGLTSVLAVTIAATATRPAQAEDSKSREVEISRREAPVGMDADALPVAYMIIDVNGKQVTDAKFRREVSDGKSYVVAFRAGTEAVGPLALTCEGWNSPAPTYSWTDHTMHYGMWGQCSEAVEVRARGSLWSGPYPESANTLQDSLPGGGDWTYGIGTVSIGRVRRCTDWGGFDWWELMMYFEVFRPWGWTQFVPYPARSVKENECLDTS